MDSLRIAFFTPLSPLKTAIADHSEGLVRHLADFADIDLIIDTGYEPSNPEIISCFDILDYRDFPACAHQYDAILYAMGDNASFHGYIYEMLQRYPGVVILHDTTLHRTLINLSFGQGRPELYFREMRYAYGVTGSDIPQQVLSGYGQEYVTRYPLFERVVDSSLGLVVHNSYARQQILRRCPDARVTQINQHFFLPPGFPDQTDVTSLRAQWGLEGRFVVGSFGILVPDKRLNVCLRAFARLWERYPEAIYLLVGNHPPEFDLPGLIHGLGLDGDVVVTGWLDPVRFTQNMYLADVGIHLRYPHIGGTPFTPIRLMGMGVPTIVSDISPLCGLPQGACAKIAPDQCEEETLSKTLMCLADRENVRQQLSKNGARWIRQHHNVSAVAAQYIDFIRATLGKPPPGRDRQAQHRLGYLVQETAAMARAMGIRDEDDDLLQPLAQAIAQQLAR